MVDLASNSDTLPESSPASIINSGSTTPSTGSNYSPISSPVFSRRDRRRENTKERLFGPPEESHRRIRDNLRSSVFSPQPTPDSPQRAAKKIIPIIRRNPITGHVYEDVTDGSGRSIISAEVLRAADARSLSLPSTPIRTRPGGKMAGIFS